MGTAAFALLWKAVGELRLTRTSATDCEAHAATFPEISTVQPSAIPGGDANVCKLKFPPEITPSSNLATVPVA